MAELTASATITVVSSSSQSWLRGPTATSSSLPSWPVRHLSKATN